MRIAYAAKVAAYEFCAVMAGRPTSKERMRHFRRQAQGSHADFKYVQKRMFRYRAALEAIGGVGRGSQWPAS